MKNPIHQCASEIQQEISEQWDSDIIPQLVEYIKIPNKSPAFDPDWQKHGYMQQAIDLVYNWCQKQPIDNMHVEVINLPERTPLLLIEIDGHSDDTVLLYGHIDKQPEMRGWDADKGPWQPVLTEDKLYGRGGADDGYAVFSSLSAIAALQRHNIAHSRCVILIEASEESGSDDLPAYLEHLRDRIGQPNLVICLDSGAANYEQMWSTTSLRGLASGTLDIAITKQGVHSGVGSGVIPSCTLILRQLLDRLEDVESGQIILDGLKVDIPAQRQEQAQHTAQQLGDAIYRAYPFVDQAQATSEDPTELLLNRTWRAQLSVIGMDGLPSTQNAGNVTIPELAVKLSIRLAPTTNSETAIELLKETLEQNPPFNAKVTFTPDTPADGWHAPELSDWLAKASDEASLLFFNKPTAYIGEGGTIPFMAMLGDMFPQAQFLITGVLGPKSNAHGPNEFLHIPMVKKITACVAAVLANHHQVFNG